jgi:S1-C subfamily serine protease
MKIDLKNGALVLLLALAIPSAQAALPNVTADGKPFPTLAPMLKKVNPAVVNIATYSKRETQYNPLLNDPFFRRFFDLRAGSGVIVDADDGIVMTNYHVIRNADEVQVSLIDGRSLKAQVVGTDPQLDIAILEVEAEDLTEVKLADSSLLEVGDFVVAIGNPFGLGQTVTTGIVSALGRSGLGMEGYENFIQTDASINPGNSGGALVNLAGELVGINTAIISPAGGNVGIIGVGIQDITPELRDAFNLKKGEFGVLVTNVFEDTPAAKSGLETGDIIIEVDGQQTRSAAQLRSRIGIKQVGDEVRLKFLRDGKTIERKVEIGAARSSLAQAEDLPELLAGLRVETNTDGDGVLVIDLAPNSPAAYSGLRPGDVIVGTNKRRVRNIESFREALALSKTSILLRVERNGGSLFIVIR